MRALIMCIAFPYGRQDAIHRGPLSRGWWLIARSPLRLYAFGTVFHALVILSMYLLGYLGGGDRGTYATGLFVLFGIPGWSMLGFILQKYPRWFRCSDAEYASYGVAYSLAFVSLVVAEAGMFGSLWLNVVAFAMLALAWRVSLNAIGWMHLWGYGVERTLAPYLSMPLRSCFWLILAAIPVSLFNLLSIGKVLLIAACALMLALGLGLLGLSYQASRSSASA